MSVQHLSAISSALFGTVTFTIRRMSWVMSKPAIDARNRRPTTTRSPAPAAFRIRTAPCRESGSFRH